MIGGYSTSGQVAGSGQVRGGGQAATCQPCGATQPKAQNTYTYKPAKPATPAPKAQTSTHDQQYYVDKWNREQAQA